MGDMVCDEPMLDTVVNKNNWRRHAAITQKTLKKGKQRTFS